MAFSFYFHTESGNNAVAERSLHLDHRDEAIRSLADVRQRRA